VTEPARRSPYSALIDRIHVDRSVGRMALLVLVAFAFFAVLNPRVFLNTLNLQNIALAAPEIGVLALAMMLAMLTGGIDLSVVSTANLSAILISSGFTAIAATDPRLAEQSTAVLVLGGLTIGLLCGLVNGVLVAFVGITPILATLGTMQVYNGLAIVWTGGSTLEGSPAVLTTFGQATVAGVPVLFLVFVAVAAVVALAVNRTPIGLKLQLQGANPAAARYSGISSRRVLMLTYLVTGVLGGVAGVLFIARNLTASADYGASYVLLIIVVAVLGGTNPSGGFATVLGVVLATVTLQIVASGFTALRLSAYQYAIAQGVILIVAIVVDRLAARRNRRRSRRPSDPEPMRGEHEKDHQQARPVRR
jgi:simple sugar transport system permease protein